MNYTLMGMWFHLSIIMEVNFPGKYDTFTLAISFMFAHVSMAGCSSAEELQIHPSASCRFCEKNLKCSGGKVPCVSLFNIVKNKEIVGYSGEESLVLGDIARSLGHELNRDEYLSDVSCLTCAKLLAKTHASISKLFTAEARYSQRASGKRQSSARSPTGVTPSAKRAPAAVHVRESTTPKSRRSLDLGSTDKENALLGVAPIQDKIDSLMDFSGDKTVMKVSLSK